MNCAVNRDAGAIDAVCKMFGEVAGLVADDWAMEHGHTFVPTTRASFIASVEREARDIAQREPALLAPYLPLPLDLMRRAIRFDIEPRLVRALDDATAAVSR
jgi:hypothetical protein